MKAHERDILLYLEDISVSMSRVCEYIQGLTFLEFKRDYKTVDAVIRNFEIIGEASKNIPMVVREKYPQMPWEEMYRLRNRISHEYFGIDYEILWDIASNHLPQNHDELLEIIRLEGGK